MERMFSMMCSMICWPRMVHWFVRFIGPSFGGSGSSTDILRGMSPPSIDMRQSIAKTMCA